MIVSGPRSTFPAMLLALGLLVALTLTIHGVAVGRTQETTSSPLTCAPLATPGSSTPAPAAATAVEPVEPPEDAVQMTVGYVPISIYAPLFVAKEKGYYAEQGLDVSLESFAGGGDLVALTATGDLDAAASGAGPAFWNAVAVDLPVSVVAPGHSEGSPVATPLMISREACESGSITRVADLRGKKVSVNARGATEYWLGQALATDGLTIEDIDLQTLPFPDAVAALSSGALDAAMVAEPVATGAEQQGLAVRLLADFPVQDVQPTVIVANDEFIADHPDAMQGFVTAYLKASRDLAGPGFKDPTNLAIIETYTSVPATLVGAAVQPVYSVDGRIDTAGLGKLQAFFRQLDQLEYDEDIDPATLVDDRFIQAALAELGPYEQ